MSSAIEGRLYWDFRSSSVKRKKPRLPRNDGIKREFDFNEHRYKTEGGYTKKQKRSFQRLMSGLALGKNRNERLRFMTLTTSDEAKSLGFNKLLNNHFRTLKMRILRKYHFKMKYWKIRTNEGNGVLHIVFRGKYIHQKGLALLGLKFTCRLLLILGHSMKRIKD